MHIILHPYIALSYYITATMTPVIRPYDWCQVGKSLAQLGFLSNFTRRVPCYDASI